MFTKQDDQFAEVALNPERRRAAIADLSQRRTIICWIAIFMFAMGFLESWMPRGTSFMGLFFITFAFKMESDLRLLKVIERQDKNGITTVFENQMPSDAQSVN